MPIRLRAQRVKRRCFKLKRYIANSLKCAMEIEPSIRYEM